MSPRREYASTMIHSKMRLTLWRPQAAARSYIQRFQFVATGIAARAIPRHGVACDQDVHEPCPPEQPRRTLGVASEDHAAFEARSRCGPEGLHARRPAANQPTPSLSHSPGEAQAGPKGGRQSASSKARSISRRVLRASAPSPATGAADF